MINKLIFKAKSSKLKNQNSKLMITLKKLIIQIRTIKINNHNLQI